MLGELAWRRPPAMIAARTGRLKDARNTAGTGDAAGAVRRIVSGHRRRSACAWRVRLQTPLPGANRWPALGTIALAMTAIPLGAPYGRPSALQLVSLAAAVAFEIIAIVTLVPRAARRGERAVTLTLLAIVGAHLLNHDAGFRP